VCSRLSPDAVMALFPVSQCEPSCVPATTYQVGRRSAADCQRYVVVAAKDVWP
jgi:hypothetical protein